MATMPPAFFHAWGMDTDIGELRESISRIREAKAAEKPPFHERPWTEEDMQISVRDGSLITIRVHKPKSPSGADGRPGMVMFHGGGFMMGDLDFNAEMGHLFTSLGGIAVDVDFRQAPEYPFPTPIEDCLDALIWVSNLPLPQLPWTTPLLDAEVYLFSGCQSHVRARNRPDEGSPLGRRELRG